MRRFIVKLVTFGASAFICGIVLYCFLLTPQRKLLTMPEDVTTVWLGNSTVEYGINDSLIHNSVNWGINSERIECIYAKIKLLKKYNPQFTVACVEFDDVILANKEFWNGLSHPFYFGCFDTDDIINNILNQSFYSNTEYLSHSFDFIKLIPIIQGFSKDDSLLNDIGLGGYHHLNRDKLKESIDYFTINGMEKCTVSESNLYYYHKIKKFCRDNKIKLVFFATPRHSFAHCDTVFRQYHREYFKEVPLIDLTDYELPDSCYGDILHVNYRGAKIVSKYLDKILKYN